MDEKAIDFDPLFGAFILETLTVGMYEVPRLALREYIQNAFDSTREAIRMNLVTEDEAIIEVTLKTAEQEVIIRDNGVGLPAQSAAKILTSIGASTKSHRSQAGFRGIGRLAGIAFANKIRFSTKFRNDPEVTEVTFDGSQMRELMKPGNEHGLTAQSLLKRTVTTRTIPARPEEDHFFEVRLIGFTDPPTECTSVADMKTFLSHVAPVDYAPDFSFREKVRAAALEFGLPVEAVKITVRAEEGEATEVFKPYGELYAYQGRLPDEDAPTPDPTDPTADVLLEFEGSKVTQTRLRDVDFYESKTKRWFMWVGKKGKSGAYIEPSPWGIRARVKNIQIDGTDLMADVFGRDSASNKRFNQWCVGEVFFKADALVPNARRDGFEHDPAWKEVKDELFNDCTILAREIRILSSTAQLALDKLKTDLASYQKAVEALKEYDGRQKIERAIACANNLDNLHARFQKSKNAAKTEDQPEYPALFEKTKALRTQAVALISGEQADIESLLQDARDAQLAQLTDAFQSQLGPDCLSAVRGIVKSLYGVTADIR
ncbi:MAG TPA: ATP-binding protein [Vicinamibacterales bacterium]|nr:ATP-binding protein [Vicinamibacterales bacterium]